MALIMLSPYYLKWGRQLVVKVEVMQKRTSDAFWALLIFSLTCTSPAKVINSQM